METDKEYHKVMKRRMMRLVMITVLAASSLAMVACQTEESAANEAATSSSSSSSVGGLETFTTVAAWGDNFFGQLGNGVPLPYPDDSRSTMPLEVSNLDGAELKAIAGGRQPQSGSKERRYRLGLGLEPGRRAGRRNKHRQQHAR